MNIPDKWKLQDGQLYRKFVFKDFKAAFAFMTSVAVESEKLNHHPTWTNTYNSVEIWLTTHSAGQVTQKDLDLAQAINLQIS